VDKLHRMATTGTDREAYFPLIEKKYGEKMSYWFARMKEVEGAKYPEQIAFLRENYGFIQAHANALVMYTRGSKNTSRFADYNEFLTSVDAVKAKTIQKIFKAIQSEYPELELVIAWNQPMLRVGTAYIFGLSVTTNYLLLAPWSKDVLADFADELSEYTVNKKTIQVPSDWKVDASLLQAMAGARLAEIKQATKKKAPAKKVAVKKATVRKRS